MSLQESPGKGAKTAQSPNHAKLPDPMEDSRRRRRRQQRRQQLHLLDGCPQGQRGVGGIAEAKGGHVLRPATRRADRHSKVCTTSGLRDRRVRLSAHTAIQFYDVQDRLGYDRPSKAVDWLIMNAKAAIDELAPSTATPTVNCHHPKEEEDPYGGTGTNILPPSLHCDAIADTIKSFFHERAVPPGEAQDLRLSFQSFQEQMAALPPPGFDGVSSSMEERGGYVFQAQPPQPHLDVVGSSFLCQRGTLQSISSSPWVAPTGFPEFYVPADVALRGDEEEKDEEKYEQYHGSNRSGSTVSRP